VSATSAQAAAIRAPERTRLDRVLAVIPAAAIAAGVLVFYFVEAWTRKTPWVFTDEVEWTQISRSIASTGHSARRGQPIFFKSLYAWVIAPCWWIHSTATAYSAIKYVNAVVMTLTAVPTYLLARMLVSKRSAVAVATLSVLIPGMAYVTSLLPEVLGYPWYALCSLLIVRALATRGRADIALAVAVAIGACFVRWTQFATVPAAFLIAAAGLWVTGPRGKEMRKDWTRGDTFAAVVLLAGALILFNRVILQHVEIWQISTQYWKNRMVDLGLRAALAFVIGIGILPVLGGFAALRLPERRGNPVYRAFAAYLAATIFCVALYTAIKAAYLSTVFSTLTEERNMIYLSPVLLIGTALVFEARRIDWRIVAAVSAFVAWLVWAKPVDLHYPYFEAPGFGILNVANRHFRWDVTDLRLALVVVLVLSLALLALRRVPGVAAFAVVLSAAWMLTSEIATTAGTDNLANAIRRHLPAQLDWIDARVHGEPVTYLGQEIKDPNGLWLTEFWNRSIKHVDSLDGSAPGPGPTGGPDLLSADGRLSLLGDAPYIVADNGVTLQAPKVARWNQLVLYRRQGPWRLLDGEQQVYSDGWAPGWSTYTYFKPKQRGTLRIVLSRTGYNGSAPPGHAVVSVGTVKIVGQQAQLGRVFATARRLVRNNSLEVIEVPVRRTPVRVEVRISPTFRASVSDPRDLGAQVGFRFVPATG
jgi:hypothetical protein